VPEFKIFLAANYTPTIYGQDLAIWRRIKMVPFDVTIPEEDRDPDLTQKLLEEAPGILNWALEGCRQWQESGLQAPDEVVKATSEYRSEMDILRDFVEEKCVVGDGFKVPQKDLWDAYRDWCSVTDEKQIGRNSFYRNLESKGHRRRVIKGVKYLTGIGLISEVHE
jgi:putative DNA primase/helicase